MEKYDDEDEDECYLCVKYEPRTNSRLSRDLKENTK